MDCLLLLLVRLGYPPSSLAISSSTGSLRTPQVKRLYKLSHHDTCERDRTGTTLAHLAEKLPVHSSIDTQYHLETAFYHHVFFMWSGNLLFQFCMFHNVRSGSIITARLYTSIKLLVMYGWDGFVAKAYNVTIACRIANWLLTCFILYFWRSARDILETREEIKVVDSRIEIC
jgi:hypothetical protein